MAIHGRPAGLRRSRVAPLRLLAALSLLLVTTPASAQTRIVVSSSNIFLIPGRIFGYELETGRTLWSSSISLGGEVAQTSDGRYAVEVVRPSDADGRLRIVEHATGVEQMIQLGPGALTGLRAHPRRPAIYLRHAQDIISLEAGAVRRLLSGCSEFDLSLDGRVLVARCDATSVVVADAVTGALLRRVPIPESAGNFSINGDASRLVAANREIALYDLQNGAVIKAVPAPAGANPLMRVVGATARRNQVFVGAPPVDDVVQPRTVLVDASTLEVVQVLPTLGTREVVPTPDGRFAVAASASPDFRRGDATLIDLAANRVVAGHGTGRSVHVAVSAAPLAPIMAPPEVSAGTVRLTWSLLLHSPAAIEFVVEAGSQPGLTDLGTMSVAEGALTIPNVPPGTYYVRVKGKNFAGVGPPSNEAVVVVR